MFLVLALVVVYVFAQSVQQGTCRDRKLSTGAPWHDASGAAYTCAGYYRTQAVCTRDGASFPFNGFTAKQACCICGGGISIIPATEAKSAPGLKTATTTPKVTTVPPKMTSVPPKVASVPPKVASVPPKVASVPPKVASVPPKVASVPPKVASVSPKVTTVPPKVTTVPPKVTTIPPKKVTTIPPKKVTTIPPKVTTVPPKVTTTPPKVTTVPPKSTAAPKSLAAQAKSVVNTAKSAVITARSAVKTGTTITTTARPRTAAPSMHARTAAPTRRPSAAPTRSVPTRSVLPTRRTASPTHRPTVKLATTRTPTKAATKVMAVPRTTLPPTVGPRPTTPPTSLFSVQFAATMRAASGATSSSTVSRPGLAAQDPYFIIVKPNVKLPSPLPTPANNPDGPAYCQDITLIGGGPWHDMAGTSYNCDNYYSLPSKCQAEGGRYAYAGVNAQTACCVCGGGIALATMTARRMEPATVLSWQTFIQNPLDWISSDPPDLTYGDERVPPSVPPPGCVDLTVNGQEWHDAGGVEYTCASFYSIRGNCALYGDEFPWGGLTANTACCMCG